MCLIHNINADTRISTAWLRNIYNKNEDGIGAMLWEDNKLVVKKYVPKNFKRALRWFRREVEGRLGVVHWRYATHGSVNLDNAHPYPVLTKEEDGVELWMMHNGVVDFDASSKLEDVYEDGYKRGRSQWGYDLGGLGASWGARDDRSDTYHMIRTLILPLVKPSLGGNPANIRNDAVKALLNQFLGDSNKLVFMDDQGQITYINGHVFVGWKAYDLYCSNTYAWASKYGAFEDPDAAAKADNARLDAAKGDPRLQGKGGAITTFRGGYSTAERISQNLERARLARINSARYENEVLDDIDHSSALGHAITQQTSMFADDLDSHDMDDTLTDADEAKLRIAEDWADRQVDELRSQFPAVMGELCYQDLLDYYGAKGTGPYNVLFASMLAGQMTDMEFVDHILDALQPA